MILNRLIHYRFAFFGVMILLSLALHRNAFRQDLISVHVWRQTETQTVIRNFVHEDFNILNPHKDSRGAGEGLHRKEFPIMQWLFASFYKIFGDHIIISRILSFIIGIFTLMGFYRLSERFFTDKTAASAATWMFCFSPVFYYYTVAPMPDNFALMSAIWGWAFFMDYLEKEKSRTLYLSALFLMLSTLSKLPFAVFYGLPFYLYIFKPGAFSTLKINKTKGLVILSASLLPSAIWYTWVIPTWNGNPIVTGMLTSDASFSQITGYLWSNLISTLPELLLNYGAVLFFLIGFILFFGRKIFKKPLIQGLLFTLAGILLYFLFEINAIEDVHDYYLFPFLPLLFITATYGFIYLIHQKRGWRIFAIILLLILPIAAALRINHRWDPSTPGFNVDLLKHKKELRNAVPDDALVVAGNDRSGFIFFYYIDKKGWNFYGDYLPAEVLNEYIQQGAEYLYTDDPGFLQNENYAGYLGKKVGQAGSISIYKLRRKKSG